MAFSSASIVTKNSYSRALSPLVALSTLFGPGERLYSKLHSWLGGIMFVSLLGGMTFVAVIGVFVRTTIDTWIQFSLYTVPLIALVAGFRVYTSSAFYKLLQRKLEKFLESDQDIPWHETKRKSWLRKAASKICIYPFVLEIYQWTAYTIFHTVFQGDNFAGSWVESHIEMFELDSKTWLGLYGFFWVMAMYVTGFVAYTFILISRLTVRDVVCFMCMFGDSPFLMHRPSGEQNDPVLKNLSPFRRVINGIFGFLFMDFFQTGKDIVLVYDKDTPVLDEIGVTPSQSTSEEVRWNPQESQGFDDFSASIDVMQPTQGRLPVPKRPQITPVHASKYLSNVMGSVEALAGLFQPFIILITFFSVANLVTHVGAIVSLIENFKSSHWWTFVRTCIWLLLSLRLLWSAAGITKALSHVSQHLNYLWSVGQLHGNTEEWQRFFKLVESFHLGTKTYGFPLTLKQAASIATFINFALIIVLSIMKPSVHLPARGD